METFIYSSVVMALIISSSLIANYLGGVKRNRNHGKMKSKGAGTIPALKHTQHHYSNRIN